MVRTRGIGVCQPAEDTKPVLQLNCRSELPGLRQLRQVERSVTPPSSYREGRLPVSHITYIKSEIPILTEKEHVLYVTGDNLASDAAPMQAQPPLDGTIARHTMAPHPVIVHVHR